METPTSQESLFCAYHPSRPTSLRCNRCGNPICTSCAVRTPVGYRCRTCVRQQQKIFETARWYDFGIAFFLSAAIIGAGSILTSIIGWFILLAAAFVGGIAARAVNWAIRHRRSRYLWLAAAAGGIAGCLPGLLIAAIPMVFMLFRYGGEYLLTSAIGLLWPIGYMIIAVGLLVASLKGLRLG
jgi:hypothetical protein